jgi:AraC-like DNA-binding protein
MEPAGPHRWAGTIAVGPGALTFTGAIGSAQAHLHAAIQVLSVTSGDVLLRDAAGNFHSAQSAIIPPGIRHELVCTAETVGRVAFHDPTSPQGRTMTARLAATGLDIATVDCWLAAAQPSFALSAASDVPVVLHPVLAQAIRLPPMPLAALAKSLNISASRLGHLYSDQLGLTYPTWRRWARLQRALAAVQEGQSLTDAAYEAGFADSAHLTRACKAMFGITPSQAHAAAGHHIGAR